MKPLDVYEWLEPLALTDDFAREALEIVGNFPFYDECHDWRIALEKALPKENTPSDVPEWFIDRSQLLDELADVLDQAGFQGDVDGALTNALAELANLRDKLAALKAPALILPDGRELEFDL